MSGLDKFNIKAEDKPRLKWTIIIVILIAITAIYISVNKGDKIKVEDDPTLKASIYTSDDETESDKKEDESDKEEFSEPENIYVDVGGAVMDPHVVCIPKDSRVFEAVSAAGGVDVNAETKYINMAAICNDGEKLYIPTSSEVESGAYKPENLVDDKSVLDSNLSTDTGSYSGLINLNTASSSELQTLTGIGPSMATRILEYREQNGNFSSIDDLKKVSGIGEKKFNDLKEHICV